ncbi:MAG: metalloregulator ArsR/SmtB family transcription factor [Pseudomonadota bacterium]
MQPDEPNEKEMALMLGALGNETRLRLFRLLVRAGQGGLTVGDVQARLSVPGSTLTHHIGALRQAGLVVQRRDGRTLRCLPNFEAMHAVVGYLTDACCADAPAAPEAAPTAALEHGAARAAAANAGAADSTSTRVSDVTLATGASR